MTYEGESSKNSYSRTQEHWNEYNDSKSKSSVLKRHCEEEHNGRRARFEFKVVSTYKNDALLRQINESMRIYGNLPENRINSKYEFNQPGVVRVRFEKGL